MAAYYAANVARYYTILTQNTRNRMYAITAVFDLCLVFVKGGLFSYHFLMADTFLSLLSNRLIPAQVELPYHAG